MRDKILIGTHDFTASQLRNKRMKLMPINRKIVLEGDTAVRAGKQTVVVGLVIAAIGLIFLLIPS